jgi:hypothetical protein
MPRSIASSFLFYFLFSPHRVNFYSRFYSLFYRVSVSSVMRRCLSVGQAGGGLRLGSARNKHRLGVVGPLANTVIVFNVQYKLGIQGRLPAAGKQSGFSLRGERSSSFRKAELN